MSALFNEHPYQFKFHKVSDSLNSDMIVLGNIIILYHFKNKNDNIKIKYSSPKAREKTCLDFETYSVGVEIEDMFSFS